MTDVVDMRLGVVLMPTDPWDETVRLVERLERLGYAHIWVYDHLTWQRYQDRSWHATYPWLAGLAAATSRIRLGTMVSNPNIRHPVVLAKDAMTIDHISGGRLTLGLGAGGLGFDAGALGQEPLSPAQRVDRLAEFAGCLDGLLRGELTSHDGRWYTFSDARVLPGCVQRPRIPLAIAAGGTRALRIAARHADIWITYGDTSYRDLSEAGTRRVVAEQVRTLSGHCASAGRDPGSVDRLYLAGNTEARPLASMEAFTDFLGQYREIGFTDLAFHCPRSDDPVWSDPIEMLEAIADRHLAGHAPSVADS